MRRAKTPDLLHLADLITRTAARYGATVTVSGRQTPLHVTDGQRSAEYWGLEFEDEDEDFDEQAYCRQIAAWLKRQGFV